MAPVLRRVPAAAEAVVLTCRKCARKLDGGFGADGDQRLPKLLRVALADGGKRKPRRARVPVLEVGCLGLCPKGAVVVLRGDRPGQWLTVPAGTPVADVLAELDLAAA